MCKKLQLFVLVLTILISSIGNIGIAHGGEKLNLPELNHDERMRRNDVHREEYFNSLEANHNLPDRFVDEPDLYRERMGNKVMDNRSYNDDSLPEEYKPNFAEGRVLVKLAGNPGISAMSLDLGIGFSEMRLLNPSMESDGLAPYSTADTAQNNVFVLTLNDTGPEAVERAVATLNANPAVEIAEPDYLYELNAVPNDPQYNAQYALQKMNMESAWDITTGSKSVVVGVIDSGIDGTHPDLKDNLWVNPNPNQNGYINDIHGYNFTDGVGGIPTDENGHGTHVAGIIGAKGNNEEGIVGINWDVSLAWMGISEGGEYVSASAAIEALNYANNHDIMITNNSYGGDQYSKIFEEAILNYKGLFVTSAGNNYSDNDKRQAFPANYDSPNIISVASTNEFDELSNFSNFGKHSVHIAAPDHDILSTYVEGYYESLSGTSMASPQVAGVAALIQSINPTWSPQQVRAAICGTARPMPQLSESIMHGGIADAHRALLINSFHLFTLDFNDDVSAPFTDYVVPRSKRLEPKYWPKKEGHVFIGWHTSATGGSLFDFNTEINQDITIYAQWDVAVPGVFAIEFPDDNFRREILKLLNTGDGGSRTSLSMIDSNDFTTLAAITFLNVDGSGIRDMTGLQHFTGLQELWCDYNMLTELDVSVVPGLKELACYGNQLTKLDVSNNPELIALYCQSNRLTTLDVSNNPVLIQLYCQFNELTTLNVSNNPNLIYFDCSNNYLTTLDVSNSPTLEILICDFNELTSLDVSSNLNLWWLNCAVNQLTDLLFTNNPELYFLYCYSSQLATLDISNCPNLRELLCYDNQLTTLNVSNNPELNRLECDGNQLTALDLSNNPALQELWCFDNQLITLDVSNSPLLSTVLCHNNQLTALDFSNNNLYYLYCYNNQLTTLDISNNPNLWNLMCNNNQLTTLDISDNSRLQILDCSGNQLTELDASNKLALKEINCHSNQLTELEVFNNTALTVLICQNNQLTSLDVSNTPALITIYCHSNQLVALDISANPTISELYCYDNNIASPDNVIGWQNLFTSPGEGFPFWFYPQNSAPSLIGIYNQPKDVYVAEGQITGNLLISALVSPNGAPAFQWYSNTTASNSGGELLHGETGTILTIPTTLTIGTYYYYCVVSADGMTDVASRVATVKVVYPALDITPSFTDPLFLTEVRILINKPATQFIYASDLTGITSLNVFNMGIRSLNGIEHFTDLNALECSWNQLTELDVSNNTGLKELRCVQNQITKLDLSNNTELEMLNCYSSQLFTLDVSNSPALTYLACADNRLTTLDVSNNPALTDLFCNLNELTTLDISNNPELRVLNCQENYMASPDNVIGWQNLFDEPGTYWFDSFQFYPQRTGPTPTPTPTPTLDGIEAFVTRTYQNILERDPEPEGFEHWVNGLESGHLTAGDIIDEFFFGNEFVRKNVTDEEFITIAFHTFMDRPPGEEGFAFWVDYMLASGYSRWYVLDSMMKTIEFISICQLYGIPVGVLPPERVDNTANVEAFVTRMYQYVLLREPEPEGLEHWRNGLLNGNLTAADLIDEFFFSTEFMEKNVTDVEFIEIAFNTFMNRPPGEEGIAFWVDYVLASGYSHRYVLDSMMKSDEFIAICKLYGITVGAFSVEWIADEDGIFTQMDTAPADDVEIMEADQGELEENEPEEAETIETDETDPHGPEQSDTMQNEAEQSEAAEEVETE